MPQHLSLEKPASMLRAVSKILPKGKIPAGAAKAIAATAKTPPPLPAGGPPPLPSALDKLLAGFASKAPPRIPGTPPALPIGKLAHMSPEERHAFLSQFKPEEAKLFMQRQATPSIKSAASAASALRKQAAAAGDRNYLQRTLADPIYNAGAKGIGQMGQDARTNVNHAVTGLRDNISSAVGGLRDMFNRGRQNVQQGVTSAARMVTSNPYMSPLMMTPAAPFMMGSAMGRQLFGGRPGNPSPAAPSAPSGGGAPGGLPGTTAGIAAGAQAGATMGTALRPPSVAGAGQVAQTASSIQQNPGFVGPPAPAFAALNQPPMSPPPQMQQPSSPAQIQGPPDYNGLFRNTHGSAFNPQSQMDVRKMQQLQQFYASRPSAPGWSPNTFAREYYRR